MYNGFLLYSPAFDTMNAAAVSASSAYVRCSYTMISPPSQMMSSVWQMINTLLVSALDTLWALSV